MTSLPSDLLVARVALCLVLFSCNLSKPLTVTADVYPTPVWDCIAFEFPPDQREFKDSLVYTASPGPHGEIQSLQNILAPVGPPAPSLQLPMSDVYCAMSEQKQQGAGPGQS